MTSKLLFFDTETTGLLYNVNDIIQIAGIIEIDGKIVREFEFKMQPRNWGVIGPVKEELKNALIELGYINENSKILPAKLPLPGIVRAKTKASEFDIVKVNVPQDLDLLKKFSQTQCEQILMYMQKYIDDAISPKAIDTHGKTLDILKTFPDPDESFQHLLGIFKTYIDEFDKKDKFVVVGHNVKFDLDMLYGFFKKSTKGAPFPNVGCFLGGNLDTLAIARMLNFCGKLPVEGNSLTNVCKYLNIPLTAHDAVADIKATRTLFYMLKPIFDASPVLKPQELVPA